MRSRLGTLVLAAALCAGCGAWERGRAQLHELHRRAGNPYEQIYKTTVTDTHGATRTCYTTVNRYAGTADTQCFE